MSPPPANLPVIQRLGTVYRQWQLYVRNFPKDQRYTLGTKIDSLFIEVLELLYIASRLSREQKLPALKKASLKLDVLKFFLHVAWESKALDTKKYITLSEQLVEIGRMIGGWEKYTASIKGNPA